MRRPFNFKLFLLSAFPIFSLSYVASLVTVGALNVWYPGLIKPPLTPPDFVFAPMWLALYFLLSISFYLVLNSSKTYPRAIYLFALQLGLNFLWSIIFFGLKNVNLALVDIIILDLLVVLTIREFGKINKLAGQLLYPYLLWILFATYLNLGIVLLN